METIGGDLRQMQRTPLAASHVQALRAEGKIATYPAGTFLARPGEPIDRFVYVEEGEIEVVNPSRPARNPSQHFRFSAGAQARFGFRRQRFPAQGMALCSASREKRTHLSRRPGRHSEERAVQNRYPPASR
jgi:hypothetical protein